MFRRKISRSRQFCLGLLIYLATYVLLSARGEYQLRWSGERRDSSGLAIADVTHWFPWGMSTWPRQTFDGRRIREMNWLAACFLPLVVIDQSYVHRSQSLLE